MDRMDKDRRLELEMFMERIGYRFRDMGLLDEALTHRSVKGEKEGVRDYEKLEFFGDTVLAYIVTKHLLERDREAGEGDLTEQRVNLVKNDFLKEAGESMGIVDFMAVGRSIKSNAQEPKKMAADAMEAVIGAIFMDGGERHARAFIERFILKGELRSSPRSSSRTSRYRALIPFRRRR